MQALSDASIQAVGHWRRIRQVDVHCNAEAMTAPAALSQRPFCLWPSEQVCCMSIMIMLEMRGLAGLNELPQFMIVCRLLQLTVLNSSVQSRLGCPLCCRCYPMTLCGATPTGAGFSPVDPWILS